MQIRGKTFVVTGGGAGIGREVVLELLRRGAHVAAVDFGDIIHLYFAAGSTGTLLGAYRVVGPVKHPHAEYFGPAVTRTKLRTVLDSPLRDFLERAEYKQDGPVGAYCGWLIVPEEARSPSYIREMFPGKNALVKR